MQSTCRNGVSSSLSINRYSFNLNRFSMRSNTSPYHQYHLLAICLLFIHSSSWSLAGLSPPTQELLRGFTATPNPTITSFQAFLSDSTGNYSLGFLRVKKSYLALAVVHVASSETLWQANMARLAWWSSHTQLIFNGSLEISDPQTGIFWSTYTDGDRVVLSNTSNLQITTSGDQNSVLWQSFDFPTDTLVENQNFTSNMSIVSSNGLYSLRLGSDFMALYGKFMSGSNSDQMFWKHKALQAIIDIDPGKPIYAVLKSDGFLGIYQNSSTPADVQSFNSYQQPVSGVRRVRVEPDGNLKGYFWTGSSWVLDYQAITDECELPSACGASGLCIPGKGCSCLDNQKDHNSGGCVSPDNQDSGGGGDFCNAYDNSFKPLEVSGVELAYKDLVNYDKLLSFNECRSACERSCTCWGAVYSNSSGFCYILEYPIQTLVSVEDKSKLGYIKIREGVTKHKMNVGLKVGVGVLCVVIFVIITVGGIGWCRYRERKGVLQKGDGEIGVGPYKNLEAASFRSIELPAM